MYKEELKKKVCNAIDNRAKEIIEVGEWIWKNPEPGFKEFKTSRYVSEKFKELGLETEEGIGITGLLAKLKGKRTRPNVAVMGELDALIIPDGIGRFGYHGEFRWERYSDGCTL
jgi:metal-dependent amidase/aminoacylase/carboxypeptidase family protein